MTFRAYLTPLITVFAVGCADALPSPSQSRQTVTRIALVAGDTVHVARIEYEQSAADSIRLVFEQVEPDLVDLTVTDELDGTIVAVQYDAQRREYQVPLRVVHGRTYTLRGTVDGQRLLARTSAPQEIQLATPDSDRLVLRRTGGAIEEIPFTIVGSPPSALGVQTIAAPSTNTVGLIQSVPRTATSIRLSGADVVADSVQVRVLRLNEELERWLERETPPSTLTEGFGVFGAASADAFRVVWQ